MGTEKNRDLMNTKFLILGANGQLGKAFKKELSARGINCSAPDEKDCNITQFDEMKRMIDSCAPDVVINCAAYNAVDDAENKKDLADLINHQAVKNVAEICAANGSLFVHYGTDYVFDGNKGDFYLESDTPNPLNVYGATKLAGERAVLDTSGDSLVLRLSWVYGEGTQNFIHKLLGWASKNRILRISSDEVSIPTNTHVVVLKTLELIEMKITGLFHLTNSDYCSRYEWCRFVLETLNLDNIVIPVPMSTFSTPARRPAFAPMSNQNVRKILNEPIPHWKASMKEYLLNLNK